MLNKLAKALLIIISFSPMLLTYAFILVKESISKYIFIYRDHIGSLKIML